WNEAEEWFRKYAFLESDAKRRTEAKLKIAACRYEEGKFQEAARQAQDVLGRYSDIDEEANLLLGKALLAQGRSDDALKTWARVRSASSAGAEAAFRIGRFYEEQKEFALARAYYDSAKLRRADSDYGVLAVKRLSLLDAFASQETTSQDAAKRLFLLAEVHNLNLGDFDQALVLYQQVYDSFPGSPWAPKALFANAWLLKNIKQDSAGAVPILKRIIAEYPETEYADESRRWLGLPVPKRKVVKVTAPAETVAAKSDSIKAPEPLPESKTIEEAEAEESTARPESPREPRPGMFPKGRHRPPGARELIDEATGLPKVTLVPVAETVAAPPAEETTVTQPPRPQLEIVHFDTDSWRIRPADTAALNQNARLLLANPSLKIVLIGHCDPRGTAEYNLKLGQRRADAVRDYLVSAGIPGERIVTRSEGENRLISANPDEFWLDRRVEFQLE
ncbi:MAG: OmpA family protein, partial [candidate division WOR-3 bacterium]